MIGDVSKKKNCIGAVFPSVRAPVVAYVVSRILSIHGLVHQS